MSTKKTLAILVGGGPAPGINAVLAAATIEARNHGLRVLGCYDGFKWLVQGDTQHVVDLEINDTSRIHFDGGPIIRTSRTNPGKPADPIPPCPQPPPPPGPTPPPPTPPPPH